VAKRGSQSRIACPAKDCQGGYADRQRVLTEGQRQQIVGYDPDLSDAVAQEKQTLMRCSYCGCVYHTRFHILGFLDNGVERKPWVRYRGFA
jgi:hypothetical protein